MLWPWRRFKGIKMSHHWPPGNTRSSLNGIKSSCTLGGRRGTEGKQQLAGKAQLEKGPMQPDRLTTVGQEQTRRDVAYPGFLWVP